MSNNKPLIFITNDDGVSAQGLEALIEMACPFGDLVVVAPLSPQSCMSHAVTLKHPLRYQKIREEEGLIVYGCNGTPVDCVKLGLSELVSRKPDLLLSGINHGGNSSVNMVYSGTVAAAAEGVFYNIPCIAFSLCDHALVADFSASIHYGRIIIQQALENGIPERICLNVNIPKLPTNEIKGIRLCRQNKSVWVEKLVRCIDPYDKPYFWFTADMINHEPEAEDTDEVALAEGYISIMPMQFDYTAYKALDEMKVSWRNINS